MNTDQGQVLIATEAEAYIQSLQGYDVKEIGSPKWMQQHEYLEKLNMQAVISASQQEDEYIKEFLITYEKIPVLVQELITTETWVQKVFPEFIALELEPKLMFPMYMVLYHEATVANLLETVLYHSDAMESAEDSVLDLVDYCYRKLALLVDRIESGEQENEEQEELQSAKSGSDVSSLEELQRQQKGLNFDICIKVVSILRYITDHLTVVPLSVCTRLLNTHDIPILLVQLVESPPWTKETSGKLKKYVDNKWQDIHQGDRFKLTKVEAQLWLSLYQLLMREECQSKYELNDYRKNVILKLRSYLVEVVVDQVPVLGELHRYLEQLSFMEPPPVKSDLVLEQVPEIRDNILRANEGKWMKIAKKQSKTFFNPSQGDMVRQAQRWSDTFSFDMLESLITEPPKCALCGEQATKRCSRCQNEWYCRRECQVKHWKKHKQACDLLLNAQEQAKDTEAAKMSSVVPAASS